MAACEAFKKGSCGLIVGRVAQKPPAAGAVELGDQVGEKRLVDVAGLLRSQFSRETRLHAPRHRLPGEQPQRSMLHV